MRPMASDRAVLTVKEVSELLQISEGTVYKMIKEGRIPAFRIGSDWRFLKDRIVRWMAEPPLLSREFDIDPQTEFYIDPQTHRGPKR